MPNPRDFLPMPPWQGPPIPKVLTSSKWESFQGEGWKALISQHSNKGPLIILEDLKGKEFCRILIDTMTRKIRVLHDPKYTVAIEEK